VADSIRPLEPRTAVPTDDARQQLVELSAAFAAAYIRWLDDGMSSDGLTYPRLRLLSQLHCGGPAMMRELADDLRLTPRNLTAVVDALEHEGLVTRVPHPTDRRATLIELTDAGRRAADQAMQPKFAAIGELFDDLSPAEEKRLSTILGKLLDGLRRRGQRA
jgi:DNA-binding MarR family transcriptional regulator